MESGNYLFQVTNMEDEIFMTGDEGQSKKAVYLINFIGTSRIMYIKYRS